MTGRRRRARIDAGTQEGGHPSSTVSAAARSATATATGAIPGERDLLLPRLRLPALAARDRRAARLPALRRLPLPPRLDLRVAAGPRRADQRIRRPAGPRARRTGCDEAREQLPEPGRHLACREDDGEIVTFAIERGWTRIGRSAAADLRLDDPSVSRRHALIVSEPGKPLRVLDDRSLNGVFLNGETVEWAPLRDGDELAIGRYQPLRRSSAEPRIPATPVPRMGPVNAAPNPVDPSPRRPERPAISAAADRARAQLHEEIERVRLGVEEMLAEQTRHRIDAEPAARARRPARGDPPLRQEAGPQDREEAGALGPQDRRPHPHASSSASTRSRPTAQAAEWRIHTDTERMLDGLLQEVRAIADLLTGQSAGGEFELSQQTRETCLLQQHRLRSRFPASVPKRGPSAEAGPEVQADPAHGAGRGVGHRSRRLVLFCFSESRTAAGDPQKS